MLLDDVKEGLTPEVEANTSLRNKWAAQIKETLSELHKLGIIWRDIKMDNVLIDDNDDAVLLDFGGGNTVGWVDQDKYGTLDGDMQGLGKILAALGEE
jgi:serine/threonine protein kinase